MTRYENIADPNSCWNKADMNSLLFILIERDRAAPATILSWIEHRIALNLNKREDGQIQDALRIANQMVEQQEFLDKDFEDRFPATESSE